MTVRNKPKYPVPELALGRKMEIIEGNAIYLNGKRFVSPLPDEINDYIRDMRLLETIKEKRVKKFRTTIDPIYSEAEKIAEELYANSWYYDSLEDRPKRIGYPPSFLRIIGSESKRDMLKHIIPMLYTKDEDEYLSLLPRSDVETLRALKMNIGYGRSNFRYLVMQIVDILGIYDTGEFEEALTRRILDKEENIEYKRAYVKPGIMKIEEASEWKKVRSDVFNTIEMRPADVGTEVLYMDRLFDDKKVFSRIKPKRFINILIDVSGSMSINREQLMEIVKEIPVNIAIYAGTTNSGTLRIIAKNDKIAARASAYGGLGSGNIVDIPALVWLSKQKGLKIWVSDGEVTGVGDRRSATLERIAFSIVEKAKIINVYNLDKLMELKNKLIKISRGV